MPQIPKPTLSMLKQTLDFLFGPVVHRVVTEERGGFGEDFKQRACDLHGRWEGAGFLSPQRPLSVPRASRAARARPQGREDPGAGEEFSSALEQRTVHMRPRPWVSYEMLLIRVTSIQ